MGEQSRETKTAYRIQGGKLARKANESDPGAKARTYEDPNTKEMKTIFEIVSDSWYGKITGLHRKVMDKNEELHLEMTDDNQESCIVKMIIDSGYSLDLMKRMCAKEFDFNQMCSINPYEIVDKGKKSYFLVINQNGNKIKSPFTLEYNQTAQPQYRLPDWEEVILGPTKKVFNKSRQVDFLWSWVTAKARKADPMFTISVGTQTPRTQPQQPPVQQQPNQVVDYGNAPLNNSGQGFAHGSYQNQPPAQYQQQAQNQPPAQYQQPAQHQPAQNQQSQASNGGWDAGLVDDLPF